MKRVIVSVIFLFAMTASILLSMTNKANSGAVGPVSDVFAFTDNWTIAVDPTSSDGMWNWMSGNEDDGIIVDNSMYQQWFWYRIDDDEYEMSIDNLELTNASNPNIDQISLSYGGASDPIQVDINYQLLEFSPTSSIINEQVTVTNTSGSSIDLSWFEYTDLDIAGDSTDSGAFPQSGGTSIVQVATDGVTNTDVRVVSGASPNRWEIAQYSDLVDSLEDDEITTLANAKTSGIDDDDYTHAFEWDLTLLNGQSLSYTKEKEATVGNFTGNDPDNPLIPNPPPPGVPPFWEFDPVPVVPGVPWWFDPVVATGYQYDVVGSTFDEIELPLLPNGDNLYDLSWLGGGATDVPGGSFFDILDTGLSSLTVTGIDIADAVDPNDPTAFITGFLFETSGNVTLTMTPITTDTDAGTPVPEPSTFILIGAGLLGLGVIGRRRKNLKSKK